MHARLTPTDARPPVVHPRIALGLLVAALLVLIALPASALGGQPREEITAFTGADADAGAFAGLGRIAVHQASGTVYAIDAAAGVVDKFNAAGVAQDFSAPASSSLDGNAVTAPDGPVTFGLGAEADLAVDNSGTASDGHLVVLSESQQTVWVFDATGAYLHRLTGFGDPCGVAVDSEGHVWVADYPAQAVSEYDASGVATGASVDVSGHGGSCHIAFDGADNLYVARYAGAVEKYDAAGAHVAQIDSAGTYALTANLATGDLFAAHADRVSAFDAAGARLGDFADGVSGALSGVGVNQAANTVYVADAAANTIRVFGPPLPDATVSTASAVQLDGATLNGSVNPAGETVTDCHFDYGPDTSYGTSVPCVPSAASIPADAAEHAVSAEVSGLDPGKAYHFKLVVVTSPRGTTESDDQTFATGATIADEAVKSVDVDAATVSAEVNPYGLATTYHVEYGTDASYGQSTPESASIGSDTAGHPISVKLTALAEDATYHWRVVATNAAGAVNGADRTFTTFASASDATNCPNQRFRIGAGAALVDCRAYELVSPVDKNGGEVKAPCESWCRRAEYVQSSPDGNKLTYSAYAAFGDQPSAPFSSQYLSGRGDGGWSTHGINPPRDQTAPGFGQDVLWDLDTQWRAFNTDLTKAWVYNDNLLTLTADASQGSGNLYERDNVTGGYSTLTPESVFPAGSIIALANFESTSRFWGKSEDDAHQIYDANTTLYDFNNGQPHVISVLPDGSVSHDARVGGQYGTTLGAAREPAHGDTALDHAVSDDGSRVFWSDGGGGPSPGNLYVRIDGTTPAARTVAIVDDHSANFRQASADGSKVLIETNGYAGYGSLSMVDVDSGARRLIADNYWGLLGASDDLSRLYFTSTDAMATGATAGQQNLYLEDHGVTRFVAGLSETDLGRGNPGSPGTGIAPDDVNRAPALRPARVTDDGGRIVFHSTKPLTGYDNTDRRTGEAVTEVFTYDADDDQLLCVSCNPSGARPEGQPMPLPNDATGGTTFPGGEQYRAAAWIPVPGKSLYSTRVMSDDGDRIFFNGFDALTVRDTNGVQDVYEWKSQGTGGCAKPGGCVALISSGKGTQKAEFVDASANGHDVFFSTSSSLVPQDPGRLDIYDARIDGGVPSPPASPPGCTGNDCQAPSPAPADTPTGSNSSGGPGNVHGTRGSTASQKVKITRKAVNGSSFTLTVSVPAKGRLAAGGAGLRSVVKQVSKAGTYKVTFALTAAAKRTLGRKRTLKVTPRVRFAPAAGRASQASVTVTLKHPKKTRTAETTGRTR